MPADFPPAPFYQISDANVSGSPLAWRRVIHRRQVAREIPTLEIAVGWGGEVQAAWRDWLCALGGKPTLAACTRPHVLTVQWQNEKALRREIVPEQRAVEADFAAMVADLLANQVLLRDEATAARPYLRIELIDARGKAGPRLPEPATLLAPPPARPRHRQPGRPPAPRSSA